ncbi:hypothetical protein [Fibrobacter succinogenes]|uniref:InlB B-repeat-containing protein n=1 Tax=Fibrobacter succinogenes TaxID=833 RepID=UPI001569F843|nr:hypothetical protein [Fibrobacter succinogenes]
MRKNICLGLGATLAFAVSVYAQEYKINKVGSNDEQSFNILLNQIAVTQAAAGSWLDISPVVPEGKVFKGFTVYDEYGMFPNQQRVSTTTKEDTRFLMPNHDVYVKATYESLRYSLVVNSTDNGNVLISFNDRTRDRTKPGTKVTVTPNPSDGYTVESIVVCKKQDANVSVECVKDTDRTDGSCSFDMPNFDVLVSANFVSLAELSSSSAVLVSSSSQEPLSSSSIVESSSSVAPVSSSAVESSSSAVAPESSSSAVPSSSSVVASSSSAVQSSSSETPASSSSVFVSSSSAVPSSSSVVASSSSAAVSSSSAKPASSSSVKVSSSSAKPVSSSSAKAASSSSKKASSSSAKPASSSSKPTSSSAKSSSSIADVVVEAVATEEDLPSCTVKRENMTYYVSTLKAVFVCKGRMWNRYNPGPNALPIVAFTPKFSAVVKGRSLQVTGAKVGANVGLFDLQGRVIYNGRAESANFSMNVPQSGSFLLRVGTQQKIVNIH